jgi:hypothetical protein
MSTQRVLKRRRAQMSLYHVGCENGIHVECELRLMLPTRDTVQRSLGLRFSDSQGNLELHDRKSRIVPVQDKGLRVL